MNEFDMVVKFVSTNGNSIYGMTLKLGESWGLIPPVGGITSISLPDILIDGEPLTLINPDPLSDITVLIKPLSSDIYGFSLETRTSIVNRVFSITDVFKANTTKNHIHQVKQYVGFTDVFNYCSDCGERLE